jgi:hypothetical protein
MSWEDITEAKASDFVKDVMKPFYAAGMDDALAKGAHHFGVELDRKWKPLKPALIHPTEIPKILANCAKVGMSKEDAAKVVHQTMATPIFKNDKYQVSVYEIPAVQGGWPALIHLSIKRLDKEPIFDWRDMQKIKNNLLGPEHEGVQLFPAESRKVDGANQFHMFCLKDITQFPFGFTDRLIVDEPPEGGKQRPGA